MIGDGDLGVFYNPDDFGVELKLTHTVLPDWVVVVLFDADSEGVDLRKKGRSAGKKVGLKVKSGRVVKSDLPDNYSEYLVVLDGKNWRISDSYAISASEVQVVLVPEAENGEWLRD